MVSGADAHYNVKGLVALITGGGTGIGLMMTKALAQNGAAKIYIAARRIEPLQEAASAIGENVIPIQCDVTSKADLERAVQTVNGDAGYLNLLICNSGVTGPGGDMTGKKVSVEEFSARHMSFAIDDYMNPFTVNVAGVWFTTMAFLPLLDAGNKAGNVSQTSQVLVIGSIAGLVKTGGAGWAYGQSKAASIHASKQLATLLPRWNMRANCITPGFFQSDLAAPGMENWKRPDGTYGDIPKRVIPLGRLGYDDEIGGTVLYLASKAGAYTNGSVILVDGATLSRFPSVL